MCGHVIRGRWAAWIATFSQVSSCSLAHHSFWAKSSNLSRFQSTIVIRIDSHRFLGVYPWEIDTTPSSQFWPCITIQELKQRGWGHPSHACWQWSSWVNSKSGIGWATTTICVLAHTFRPIKSVVLYLAYAQSQFSGNQSFRGKINLPKSQSSAARLST